MMLEGNQITNKERGMETKDTSPHHYAIDRLNAGRFQFANSGFAKASQGDHEAARQLSLRMLESVLRMQEAPFHVTTVKLQPPHQTVRADYSVW